MKRILDRIAHHAALRPQHPAVADSVCVLSYKTLHQEIERAATTLPGARVGLLMANGCTWTIIDLALHTRGATSVPMPTFFSDGQLRHLIADAGLDVIITDQAARVTGLLGSAARREENIAGQTVCCFDVHAANTSPLPPGTAKITYTSGTTGQPKGVCLTSAAIARAALSLTAAVGATPQDKTLSLLPLSTLLENIGGIYAPLFSGGTAHVPDLTDCGISGSTGVRADPLMAALHRVHPTVTVLVPHLLKIIVEAMEGGAHMPDSLRFIAVGGAPVSPALLQRARALGLPVYQGYGLSEMASVVSLNTPGDERIGSAGRPLPHVAVRIAPDGEIMVRGNLFMGYLGQTAQHDGEWPTGDTGFLDADGYLYITGRKKTAYATAHGRKLAPEWVESELTGHAALAQAAVFGEGRLFNCAVIVPSNTATAADIERVVTCINNNLPDYARVRQWILAAHPFSPRNGMASSAGVINRKAIAACYASQIESLYAGDTRHAVL